MSSRRMSLLPRATLHSDSEHLLAAFRKILQSNSIIINRFQIIWCFDKVPEIVYSYLEDLQEKYDLS
jgi:hypothetical protein